MVYSYWEACRTKLELDGAEAIWTSCSHGRLLPLHGPLYDLTELSVAEAPVLPLSKGFGADGFLFLQMPKGSVRFLRFRVAHQHPFRGHAAKAHMGMGSNVLS